MPLAAVGQHLVGKVESVNGRLPALLRSKSVQRNCHVAGACTEIKNFCVWALQDVGKDASGAPPPEPVNVHRQGVIGQVIPRRNLIEHLLHGASGGLLVRGARGSGTPGDLCLLEIIHATHDS
jgi:hypothetical protein